MDIQIGLESYTTISERISNRKTKSRERIAQIKLYTLEGKTQSEIAKLMGVSQSTISKWIRKSEEEGTRLSDKEIETIKEERAINSQTKSRERIAQIKLYTLEGKTQREIAKLMGVSQSTIGNWIRKSKEEGTWLTPDEEKEKIKRLEAERDAKREEKSQERIAKIKGYILEGKKQSEIAELMEVSVPTIGNWIRKSEEEGTWFSDKEIETIKEERAINSQTKSQERIAQVKLYVLEGKTQSEIAELMGVSQPTICRWIRKSEEEGKWLKNEDTEKHIQLTEKEVLMEYIKKRKTIPDIAILMDTTNDVVIRMMKRYDLFNTYNELHPSQEKKHRSLKKRAKGKKASNKQQKKPADETGKQSRAEKVSTTRGNEKEAKKNAITDYLREILNKQPNREEKTRQIRDNFGKISSKEETLANLRKKEYNSGSLDDTEGPIV